MVCERPPAAFGGSPPHGGENGVNLPLSRKKDRKSFVFDSPSSLLSWGRPTGLAGDTREGETRAKRASGVAHTPSRIGVEQHARQHGVHNLPPLRGSTRTRLSRATSLSLLSSPQPQFGQVCLVRGGCGIKRISTKPTLAPQPGWSLTRSPESFIECRSAASRMPRRRAEAANQQRS